MKEVPVFKDLKGELPMGKAKILDFVPQSVVAKRLTKSPLSRTSCIIEEFDDIYVVVDFEKT